MFLKYLRDIAVSLREEPDKWFVSLPITFNNIKDFSDEEFYGWANLTDKKLNIRRRSNSDYKSSYSYDRMYEELAFNGLILKFSGQFFENGIPETILQTISQNILEGLATVGEKEQKKTFFADQEKIFKKLDPFKQFSNFYNFRLFKDKRLLEIYSEFISEENIDNVLDEYPNFIADIIFHIDLHLDSLSNLKRYFSKTNILKSLAAFCDKDFERFSIVYYPLKMVELYNYIFESDDVPDTYKDKLKLLFTKSFFEKVVSNRSYKYFTFGDRFTYLFNEKDFEDFRSLYQENIQLIFEKSLVLLSEIEDEVVFNLYNDRAFNCFGSFEFTLLKNNLTLHKQRSKSYNDIVVKSVFNLINKNDIKNIKFIFSSGINQILNLFSGVGNFETNCNLEEQSYRNETDNLFNELRITFHSLSEIIPEDEQQELDILQLELELYQKKFDLFYQNFE